MAPPLDPPPNMPTIVWPKLKDWLYKLWKLIVTAVNQLTGLTFGNDAATYSAAIRGLSAPSDSAFAGMMQTYGTAFQTYTPGVNGVSGSYTVTSSAGLYFVYGPFVYVELQVNISTVTTAGYIALDLPFPVLAALTISQQPFFAGRETAVTGKSLEGFYVGTSGALTKAIEITNYDNSAPVSNNGQILALSGIYVRA